MKFLLDICRYIQAKKTDQNFETESNLQDERDTGFYYFYQNELDQDKIHTLKS